MSAGLSKSGSKKNTAEFTPAKESDDDLKREKEEEEKLSSMDQPNHEVKKPTVSARGRMVGGLFGLPEGYSHRGIIMSLTMVLFFNYMSRVTIGPTKSKIQDQLLDKDSTKGSSLSTATMIGLAVFSPVFGSPYFSRMPPMLVITAGLAIRTIGETLTSFSQSYIQMFCGFFLAGVGSAALHAFIFVVADLSAPPQTRAAWMGFLFSSLFLGAGVGIGMSGLLVKLTSWRIPYIVNAAILGIAAVIFAAIYRNGPRNMNAFQTLQQYDLTERKNSLSDLMSKQQGMNADEEDIDGTNQTDATAGSVTAVKADGSIQMSNDQEKSELLEAATSEVFPRLMRLISNPTWIFLTMANTCQTALIHIFTVNAIELCTKSFKIEEDKAGLYVAIPTVLAGLVGVFSGGVLLNRLRSRYIPKVFPDYYSLKPATIMLSGIGFIGFITSLGLSLTILSNIRIFLGVLSVCQLLMSMMISPLTSAVLWSVLPQDREFAISLNSTIVNGLGCAVSPLIHSRVMQNQLNGSHSNFKESFSMATAVCSLYLLLSGMFTLAAYFSLPYLNGSLMKDKWANLQSDSLSPSRINSEISNSETRHAQRITADDQGTSSLPTSSDYSSLH